MYHEVYAGWLHTVRSLDATKRDWRAARCKSRCKRWNSVGRTSINGSKPRNHMAKAML
jgi:hypothetical protein